MISTSSTLRASLRLALAAGLCTAAGAQAAIVEYADVGGFRTFQDTLTGNVWVDLDGRFGQPVANQPPSSVLNYPTLGAYKTALENAGFTWASSTEVMALLDTLTFPSNAAFANVRALTYARTMASLWFDSLELAMGIAENTSTPTGQRQHGLVFASMPFWGTFASSVDFAAPTDTAVGLWAFMAAPAGPVLPPAVPEPGTWGLAGLALAALAVQRRRASGCSAG